LAAIGSASLSLTGFTVRLDAACLAYRWISLGGRAGDAQGACARERRRQHRQAEISPVDADAAAAASARNNELVKPPGSLGRLEEVGAWLASVYGSCPPPIPRQPAAIVCAGDHGVLAQGISAWPKEVTAIMVGEFCADRAAVNMLGRTVGARVTVLDVGVASDLPAHPRLERARVLDGTADLHEGPAMTRDQAARAVLAGVP
jgi:nicotinate-nucleotide--dimethylbenzimidazole phosphoribosyltransferase